jgi:ribonuclease HII
MSKINLIKFDTEIAEKFNKKFLGGIDEVGRGCLAGPLVTAIVVYDVQKLKSIIEIANQRYAGLSKNYNLSKEFFKISNNIEKILEIKDSKKLTPKKRRELGEWVLEISEYVHISEISSTQIDSLGISRANALSFKDNFLSAEKNSPMDFTLTDAFKIDGVEETRFKKIISGDALSFCIASASIIAKNFRDNLMTEISKSPEYSNFSFDEHKGYGTKKHIEEIYKFGSTPIHRKTFEPIKSLIK